MYLGTYLCMYNIGLVCCRRGFPGICVVCSGVIGTSIKMGIQYLPAEPRNGGDPERCVINMLCWQLFIIVLEKSDRVAQIRRRMSRLGTCRGVAASQAQGLFCCDSRPVGPPDEKPEPWCPQARGGLRVSRRLPPYSMLVCQVGQARVSLSPCGTGKHTSCCSSRLASIHPPIHPSAC